MFDDSILAVLQDRWFKLYMARFINPVYITECCRKKIPGALYRIEATGNLDGVLRGGVELGACLTLNPVLLSTDDASLNLQDKLALLKPFQEFGSDIEVLPERQGA